MQTKVLHPSYPMENHTESQKFIDGLYSEPPITSLVDPQNGDDDVMGVVLEFFDAHGLNSDLISYAEIGDLSIGVDGHIRSEILIGMYDADNKKIGFKGYVSDMGGYKAIVVKEVNWFI